MKQPNLLRECKQLRAKIRQLKSDRVVLAKSIDRVTSGQGVTVEAMALAAQILAEEPQG
jgi:hypothetical protein